MDYHSEAERLLRLQYFERALAPDTLFLLNTNDALELLDEAHQVGLILLGIEGFLVTDTGAFQPRQDFSNDLSDWHGPEDQFIEATKALISQGASIGIRFQIVLDCPENH